MSEVGTVTYFMRDGGRFMDAAERALWIKAFETLLERGGSIQEAGDGADKALWMLRGGHVEPVRVRSGKEAR